MISRLGRRRMIAIGVAVACLGLALTSFLWSRFRGALPHPSGPYSIADVRLELTVAKSSIPIHLWFPQRPLPEARDRPFPLVLFAAGWGGSADSSSMMIRNLVSNGYAVAAMNDIGPKEAGAAGETSDAVAAISANLDLSSDEAASRTFKAGDTRVRLAAKRARSVLDFIIAYVKANPTVAGVIDTDNVGFLGYSVGGAVAAETSLSDPRIKAVVNLDGGIFADAARDGVTAPYLLLYSDEPVQASDLRSPIAFKRLLAEWGERDAALNTRMLNRDHFHWFLVKNAVHLDFTDEVFRPALHDAVKRSWSVRLAIHNAVNSVVLAFFDRYLKLKPVAIDSISDQLRQFTAKSYP